MLLCPTLSSVFVIFSFAAVANHVSAVVLDSGLVCEIENPKGVKLETKSDLLRKVSFGGRKAPDQGKLIVVMDIPVVEVLSGLSEPQLNRTAILYETYGKSTPGVVSERKRNPQQSRTSMRDLRQKDYINLPLNKNEVRYANRVIVSNVKSQHSYINPSIAMIISSPMSCLDRLEEIEELIEIQLLAAMAYNKRIVLLPFTETGHDWHIIADLYVKYIRQYQDYFEQIIFYPNSQPFDSRKCIDSSQTSLYSSVQHVRKQMPTLFEREYAEPSQRSSYESLVQDFDNLVDFVKRQIISPNGSLHDRYYETINHMQQRQGIFMWLEMGDLRKPKTEKLTTYNVVNDDTLHVAVKLHDRYPGDEIAVLNMANAKIPCGPVGARAQEQELCRRSVLAFALMPIYNKRQSRPYFIPDTGVIYTPGVLVLAPRRSNPINYRTDIYKKKYTFNVISSAAVNVSNKTSPSSYKAEMTSKIVTQIRVAAANNNDHLVLGAFGCGMFGGDPKIVSKIYRDVLDDHPNYFKSVTFAIMESNDDSLLLQAFRNKF